MTTTSTRILTQVQDLIDDTARGIVHPQAGVENPDEIARALADAGFLITEDAITIPRIDLSKVTEEGDTFATTPPTRLHRDTNPAKVRAIGLAYLALAERLTDHRADDEAQVDALATLLKDDAQFGLGRPDADEIARRLVKAGVRAPRED